MKKILSILILILPWKIRRIIYIKIFGYKINKNSYIGFSIIFPKNLIMKEYSRIGHLNICKNIDLLQLDQHSIIENLNWITGFPSIKNSIHFVDFKERIPALIIGEHSAITSRHSIDCTDTIEIGKFTTLAGSKTQILTHSINPMTGKQECNKIFIGNYNFIGTSCVILNTCITSDYSIFGAMSLLNKRYIKEFRLYGGIPAKEIKEVDKNWKYFTRKEGKVD